jgi:WYL domain
MVAKKGDGASGRWSQQRRLEFIDFRLRWDGRLNRSGLTDFFGISVPQASLDIARYSELAPKNLEYDRAARVYLATRSFRALYATSSATHFTQELLLSALGAGQPDMLAFRPPVATVPLPTRAIPVDVLVALQRAMRERTGVRVVYQSLSRSTPAARVISPHAFAHDGHRWHARAYCHTRAEFRDFVISRITQIEHAEGVAADNAAPEHDTAWNTELELVLAPHPKLSKAHRNAIELDYGMTEGRTSLTCRLALAFYVLRHLRLEADPVAPPEQQQIVLKNRASVERLMKTGQAMGSFAAALTVD